MTHSEKNSIAARSLFNSRQRNDVMKEKKFYVGFFYLFFYSPLNAGDEGHDDNVINKSLVCVHLYIYYDVFYDNE